MTVPRTDDQATRDMRSGTGAPRWKANKSQERRLPAGENRATCVGLPTMVRLMIEHVLKDVHNALILLLAAGRPVSMHSLEISPCKQKRWLRDAYPQELGPVQGRPDRGG
jgi:hypothetical protein